MHNQHIGSRLVTTIRRMRSSSFRQRQFLILLVLAIVPMAIATVLGLTIARNSVFERTIRQLETVADLKNARVDDWLNGGREVAELVASLDVLEFPRFPRNSLDSQQAQAAIEAIVSTHPNVQSISLLDPHSGQVLISTDPVQVGRLRQNETYFQFGQETLFVSPVQYSVGREAPLVVISNPIRDQRGTLLAVAAIEMNLANLESVINARSGLGENGQAYLVEAFGFYVTQPDGFENSPLRSIARSVGVERVLAGQNGSDIYVNPFGVRVLGVYRWLPEAKLGLLVEVEAAEFTSQITRIVTFVVLFTIGLGAVAIVVARALTNWLVTPLEQIALAANALQAGDFSRRALASGSDEIDQLAVAFNAMAASVQRSHAELEELVSQRTADLEAANDHLRQEISDRIQMEKALARSKAEFEAIFNSISDAVIFTDVHRRIIMTNPAAQTLFNYTSGELYGRTTKILYASEADFEEQYHIRYRVGAPEGDKPYEVNYRRKDNTTFISETLGTQVKDANNVVIGFIGIIRDITERKQVETDLRQRADNLAALYEASQAFLGQIDEAAILDSACHLVVERFQLQLAWVGLVNDKNFDVQPAAAFGVREEYLDSLRVTWDDGPYGRGPTGSAIRTNQAAVINQIDSDPDYAPWRAAAKAHGYRSSAALPLRFGERVLGALNVYSADKAYFTAERIQVLQSLANQLAAAIENARLFKAEHTARQRAETLQVATQALSKTLNLSQVFAVILRELQQVVPYDSASVQKLQGDQLKIIGGYGFPNLEEIVGLSFNIVEGDNPNREVIRTRTPFIVRDAGSVYSDFHTEPHAQAGIRSWLGVPLIFGDRLIGMLALDKQATSYYDEEHARLALAFAAQAAIAIENSELYDQLRVYAAELEERVAERTRELTLANERLQELDRLKSKFVSDVSHELRTPVTNLNLYLDLLERGKPELRFQYIHILRGQMRRLRQLIEDILDLSRLEAGRDAKAEWVPVNLNGIVEQVIDVHRPQAEATGLHLVFEPAVDLPNILGDHNQLSQVATNLIINALNYTAIGHVRVCTFLSPERNQVCLQVEDTGVGIPPEDLPHLFDRFYRGQNASQSNIPGTGLGLGIAREIARLHHGEIEVYSELDVGSIFRFWLPVAS